MRFSDFLLVSDPGDLDFIVGYTEEQNIRISVSDFFSDEIFGSGNPGYIPVFTGTQTLGNSQIFQDGSNIVIGGVNAMGYRLAVGGSLYTANGAVINSTVLGADALRVIGGDGDIFVIPNDLGQSISSLRRIIHPPAILTTESATLGQLNTAISNLDNEIDILLALKVDKTSIGVPNGVASLDSGGKVPLSQIPDSIIGQVQYMGTWNAFTNTPTLNPLVPEERGHYYVVSAAGVFGGVDYQIGDWIISNGVIWEKVDNTDAVTSVFGRIGAILALEGDYQAFYPRLSQTYDNPTWINTLAFTKITGVPAFLLENQTITLSGDVTGSGKTSIASTISNNAVTDSKLRDSVGTSVIGRSASTTGDPADIQATTDGHVLLRSAGNLLFGLISGDSISSIDWSKITGTPTTLSGYGITNAYTKTESDNKFVPYTGASANVNLGSNNITANSFIKAGGTSSQFLKADGSVDTSQYVPTTRSVNAGTGLTGGGNLSSDITIAFDTTWGDNRYAYRTRQLTINGTTYDLSADRTWTVGTVNTLTTIGTSGPATLVGNTLNIPNYSTDLTGYVPYTGATQNVNLGEFGLSGGYFQADLSPTQAGGVGRLIWNNTDGTLNLGLLGGNISLHIGQQQYARVVNGTGGNVLRANYQVVKIIGAQGQRLQIGFSRADNDFNSKDSLGLIAENINSNNEGFITTSGLVEEINTTGSLQGETWVDGDTLYLSGTTFGSLTNIKPAAPIHTVIIGFVVYAHANHGKIFVKVDNGYELEELHDVAPTPYINNGVLYRDTTTNLWKSATIPTVLGYTPANAATTITINGTTYDLSANRSWTVGTVNTLTTTGTSGPATLVGSTLNIPNYTTDVSGYVPYTGATQAVNLGYNQLLASTLTINGDSLTGGSYLGFKHSTSVNSGANGYTSIYTFGTNLIGFKSISGATTKDFSFSMVGITPGIPGGRVYTMPDADGTIALLSDIPSLAGYVTLDTTQTITGFKTILRGGDVLNFKIGTDTLYGLKVAYNQNELVPSGEATWSFVNTFNRNGTGYETTPISFFRGVLVTGERLLSVSINANLLDYYGNNPSGRYPIYAYNTGVQQFASSIIVGETTGVVNPATGAIADLPAGVVANFKGRVIGSNAVNNNEFATLGQVTSTSRAAISLTTTGTSGPATYSSVTGVLNIPEYQGGVTSFNTRTGAVTLTSSDVTTALGYTPVTDARTLTINGVTYDLTANRTWTVGVNPSAREIQTYIATSGQTVFTVTGGYTVGLVDVFINGVRLTSSDYTATNGTTVVLTVGTMVGNIVDIIKYTSGFTNAVSGTGTTNELAYFTGSTVIASLSTATYPSLTELSYVKGVTSSIQTQLNGKQSTLTNPVTGTGVSGQVAYFTGTSAITSEYNLFWDATNDRLGIGANNPVKTLDVRGTLAISNSASSFWYMDRDDSDGRFKIVDDANNDRFNISTGGNVLINSTTDNGARLQVSGTGNVTNSTSGNALIVGSTYAGGRNIQIGISDGSILPTASAYINDNTGVGVYIGDNSASTKGLYVKYGGNVGIGTASPVSNDGTSRTLQLGNRLVVQNVIGTQFLLGTNCYYDGTWKYIAAAKAQAVRGTGESGAIQFSISPTGTAGGTITNMDGSDVKMIILDSGNVGIGTTSPTGKLMLYQSTAGNVFQNIVSNQGGSTQVGINLSPSMTDGELAANPPQSSIYATDSNYGANIIFANKTTGAVGNSLTERMRITSAGDLMLKGRSTTTNYEAVFYNDNSQLAINANNTSVGKTINFNVRNDQNAMTITSSGNVGIGTITPSPWNISVFRGLQIGNNAAAFLLGRTDTTPQMQIGNNAYYDTSWKYLTTTTADRYYQGGGEHVWESAISGAANSTISWIPRMMIATTGNVLIGTTTDNGDRMNISGAVSISSNLGVGRGSESGVRLSISGAGTSSAAYVIITRDSLGNDLFYVRNDGLVNTGTRATSPYNNTSAQIPNLYVSASGTLERGTASSGRFKENIINWDGNGLDTILALKPKTFKYKKDYYNKADIDFLGLIAEDVAQVSPYLADYENEDRTGQVENVRYATIVVPLIKAIQELKAELDELKSKN